VIRFVYRRLLTLLPVLLIIVFISFLLVNVMPGDPAALVAGETATPEQLAQTRERLGLDESVPKQFVDYVGRLVTLDFGTSLMSGQSVRTSIAETLPKTLSLLALSLTLAVILGVGAGTLAALYRGRLIDRVISWICAVGIALPPFVFGMVLLIPFAVNRSWFPAVGYASTSEGVGTWLRHLVLPALALSLSAATELARQTRGAMVDTLEQDYIRSGTAIGLSKASIVAKHAMKNAGIPIITVLGLQVGRLLGAAILVEQIFAIPGFGSLAFLGVVNHDLPVIQGVVLVSGVVILLANLLVDVSYGYFNPSLRR
jgi:peptide/nickel transport system permease protein